MAFSTVGDGSLGEKGGGQVAAGASGSCHPETTSHSVMGIWKQHLSSLWNIGTLSTLILTLSKYN